MITIKEFCKSFKSCNGCPLNNLCKGCDKDKFRPENYTYSEDQWVTSQLILLSEILKQ